MEIFRHPSCTQDLGAPSDMQDNCSTLPIAVVQNEDGTWAISFWKPDNDEIETLKAGGTIALHIRVMDGRHPVVAIGIATPEEAKHEGTLQ